MAKQIRSVDFLPEIFQTPVNEQFLSATLDQLIQNPQFTQTQGFIGRTVGNGVNANDKYVIEPTKTRTDYQLEPGVVQIDPADSHRVVDAITYPGINDALQLQGADTNNADRLYTSDYYSWDPFVDFDKFVNYAQYYWLPSGPLAVDVSAPGFPLTDDFTVTRINGAYTFSGQAGTNPTLTLVRGGSYNFNVAQNQTETVNFRVTNNDASSWNIDYQPNPTLTLVRGNTYVFNLSQSFPWAFYIKTAASLGTTNLYSDGVFNNGGAAGLITFTVPQNAPDTLYYSNDVQFNLRGQINIVNPVSTEPYDTTYFDQGSTFDKTRSHDYSSPPTNGPGFWIQTDIGINGRVVSTPNISSRDVLGVANNGENLGTVTFDVPLSTAQDFYYSMPSIGQVDLVTTLRFDQINNQFVNAFMAANPGGIDGITNLENRTIAFITQNTNPEAGGWQRTTFFDPLRRTSPNQVSAMVSYDVNDQPYDDLPYDTITMQILGGRPDPQDGQPGSFDSIEFDQTTFITDPAIQYGIWRIQYVPAADGSGLCMSLQPVQSVELNNKFTVGFGTQYSTTGWYKNTIGSFTQIPLLTADQDLLFYQDGTDPEIFGQIRIIDPISSTTIDIDEIIGSPIYTSPNGVVFSNGMKVVFRGNVTPARYQNQEYYVEGVGTAIQLLPVGNFITPETYTVGAGIPYDTKKYDLGNFDGNLNQPVVPDYLTINRASPDRNAWTRSNRWFHIDLITASATYNNTAPTLDNNFRAKRPILEFRAGTNLFNFGTEGKQAASIIDFTQTDALSTVNGSIGFSTDGYTLINGSTVIFAADLDPMVRNTIYTVKFVTPDTVPPLIPEPLIVLVPVTDGEVLANQSVVIQNGNTQQGLSYYYDGIKWIHAQQKNSVNQPPLFNIYDSNGISFGDRDTYPSSDFNGSPLFSYAIGNSAPDLVLGFPLTYLSLTNLGDIVFDNNLYADSFTYAINSTGQTVPLSSGFVRQYSDRVTFTREIGWQTAATPSLVRQQFQFVYDGSPLLLDVAVNENNTVPAVQIFANGTFQESYNYQYTIGTNTTTINLLTIYNPGDLIEVTVLSNQVSGQGFYQVPVNLNNNPLNDNSTQFTLGTIRNHYISIAENLIALSGPTIGANNTRDLGNIVPFGLQILQQSSPLTLTGYFMRDANYDIFASLAYNSAEYIKFKSQLLNAVTTFGIADYGNWTVARLLDASIAQITAGRTNLNSFYWSDMLPTGPVFSSNSHTVNAITTNKFNTVQTYNFTKSNYLGLCVYINDVLLTRDYDYMVSTEGPTLTITRTLNVGDVVTINEYADTAGNFVPNTPTKLGLYPKYQPKIFLDQDYVNPTPVIQGHDGSITVAFGDIRDQVLLEFEQRIFSNLKNDDNPPPLVAQDVIPGYFRKTDYTQTEINQILGESFLAWVGANKVDYTAQTYIAGNNFTYNYSQAGNKLDREPLLGAWRGIYRYFYDTLTPNLTPWEMLGLSEQPIWWYDTYGPAPYTADNLVLWEDIEAGLIKDPIAPYVDPKYIRPGLTNVIPVGGQGELLAPFYSVMGAYNPQGFQKSWTVGDGSPVEASWWMSSSYPFAVMRLLILTRPAEFFSLFADRDLYKYDADLDQYLYNGRYRIQPQNIEVYGNGVSKASYINWIVDYNQQLAMNSTDALTTDLANLDVRLCYRAASFVAQQNLNMYLEKGAPQSQNDSLLIPPESYNLLLYKNQPFDRIDYSAVIVEVVEGGYSIYGYSTVNPYFSILTSKVSGVTQTLTGGNISVTVPSQYTTQVYEVPYGYTFTTLASVVDFLLSYGQYLDSQGLTFEDQYNGYTLNWIQMAQEFLYFANQGWAEGTIINLNPSATQVLAFQAGTVVDSIVTYTPENLLLDQNRQAFNARDLIIYRQGNTFRLNPARGGNQTINYLQLKFTDYEDMIVLDNRTIFNDLIYNPVTAERQNRLKISASTSTQWNGTLNAQGFILNQDNVVAWKSNTKYTKGDIVIYKNSYWQATNIVQPKITFDYTDWYKSNYDRIQQGLLQNLATKADQLANSYDTQTANLNSDNDLLAFGLIGFQPRQYMVDLNLTNPSQVQLYQQFIKTMGSKNATDLFTRVNFNNLTGQYNIYETWGIQVGTYGAQANRSWFEVALNEAVLNGNPSTFQIVQPSEDSMADQTILLGNLWATSYAIPNTDILPTTYSRNLDTALPTAGYVNFNDVDITVFNLNDPSTIAANLSIVGNGTKIWVAQDNSHDWNIYQCVQVPGRLLQLTDNLNGTSRAQFNSTVHLSVGDLIIIRYFDPTVDGVYRVLSRPSIDTVVIEYSFANTNQTSITGIGIVFYLQTMRVSQASNIINLPYANQLIPGAQAWVDNDGHGHWKVLKKTDPFATVETKIATDSESGSLFGSSVTQSHDHYAMLVGAPNVLSGAGAVYSYHLNSDNSYVANTKITLTAPGAKGYGNSVDFGNRTWAVAGASASNSGAGYVAVLYLVPGTSDYVQTQLLVAPDQDFTAIGFGSVVKLSSSERWLYVSAPVANKLYAYGRVDVPAQQVTYVANGTTSVYNYSDAVKIDSSHPDQLLVTVNNTIQTYGVDYTLTSSSIRFEEVPVRYNKIVITRRTTKQLDSNNYTNILQNSTSGSGSGAVFTVNNTRGTYLVNITAPGIDYQIGDTLVIDYTQIAPTGSSANNLVLTVTEAINGGITGFTQSGHGVTNTSVFLLSASLYTATNYDSFTVIVGGLYQRPYIDYTFSGGTLTFINVPAAGTSILVQSATTGAYWQYASTITASGIDSDAMLGTSLTTDQLGEQILAGAPHDSAPDANGNTIANAGAVYAFDRSSFRYVITDADQLTYAIPGSYTDPVGVVLNNQYLTNTDQFVDGQFTVSGGNIILSTTVKLTVGDELEIETNQFQVIQKFANNIAIDESNFGQSIDICSNNCSVYVGAPLDTVATGTIQAGQVQRQVNQSRIYGIITNNIANPSLTVGDTLRINLQSVAVPLTHIVVIDGNKVELPGNNIAGLVSAINSAGIPNVVATASPDVYFVGDSKTQTFDIGNIYSSANSYTPVVYVNKVMQTEGVDYTYNNNTQQILFVSAPALKSTIQIVSGRITLNVINSVASATFDKLTVLPGTSGTAFTDLGFTTYAYTQTITSPNATDYARFGTSLNVNTGALNLVVGSPNGDVYEPTTFDAGKTYFDERSTTFFGYIHNSGVVYTYDYLPSADSTLSNPGKFAFGQQVYVDTLVTGDQFGTAVNYRNGRLVVGAPGSDFSNDQLNYGSISVLDNLSDSAVWQTVYAQRPAVDVNLLNSVYSYNKLLNSTQTYFDYIDPLQGKILGVARKNIDYIGAVDPGQYNSGTVHNIGTSWGAAHEGEIWWDTNSVRFIDANQDNLVYASRRWGQVFPGSTIDIYQWTASSVAPANYTGPGTSLNTTSYTVQSNIDEQGIVTTTYYFWVKGITTTATQFGKTLSPTAIASYIINPSSSGLPYISAISANAIAIYNSANLLSANDTILHVEYDRRAEGGNNDIHVEYEFIADGKAEDFLNPNLYRKLLDSFCGATTNGDIVPDSLLSPGMQYGVQFRPRQSMFGDRFKALQNYLTHVNNVLAQYPISETRSFNLLNQSQPVPVSNSGVWNYEVPNLEFLSYQNLAIVPVGYRYLVLSDSSQNGRWTIYQVNSGTIPGELVLELIQVQSYDTPLYWNRIDWYLPGYNNSIQPVTTVANASGLQTLSVNTAPVGSSVKVIANGRGFWEIYLRVSTLGTIADWQRVGLQDGTIAFSPVLWNYSLGGFGFDTQVFDALYFDQEPVTETRYIIRAINEELFIDELLIERNQSLMLMFQYIYSEFNSPSWLIKTSYIDVNHTVRGLYPYQLYQPDNQNFVLNYLTEVKPYHVQTLEFNLIYTGLDNFSGAITDYDVPTYWDTLLALPQFISPVLTPYTHSDSVVQSLNSDTPNNAQIWTEWPWNNWYNNYLLSVQEVAVINSGSGYTIPPTVEITGNCGTSAQMTAIINSAGRVVSINIDNPGSGYSETPVVTLIGGNGHGATAVAHMGNNLVRSIKTTIKYDRYEYLSTIVEWQSNVVYTEGERVRWSNRVWAANTTQSSIKFIVADWTLIPASDLSGVDRTMGYYVPTVNMPGLSLPLLIDGVEYPSVQISAPTFGQNTGFDVGNYDINPFDNISYDAEGRPTYDPAILDARYSSAYLDPYLGTRATDINVDGGKYIDTFSSYAPEELVPGSEFDTLDLRVYTTPGADWLGRGHGFPINTARFIFDPANPVLNFKTTVFAPMVVQLFNATLGLALEPLYYDWANYELTVDSSTSTAGDILIVYVTGTGGGNQLLNDTYLGSEITGGNEIIIPFPTSSATIPPIDSIYEFLIYNGEVPLYEGTDYTYASFGKNSTKITFTETYGATDRINLTALGYGFTGTTYSWSLPVFETILVDDPASLTYTLTNSVQGTNSANMIVVVDGVRARPPEGIKYVGNNATTVYGLPRRGGYNQSTIAANDVAVYINGQAQILNVNFVLDPYIDANTDRTVTFLTGAPAAGTTILISVRTAAQYWVVGDQLSFQPANGLKPFAGQIIEIITWNDTREQGLLTQVFVGPTTDGVIIQEAYDSTDFSTATVNDTSGSYDFTIGQQLTRNIYDTGNDIINPERLLVTVNGKWLFNGLGFTTIGPFVIITGPTLSSTAVVAITSLTQSTVPGPMAFRVFQDMRGVQATYRITADTTTTTRSSVAITDDVIYVNNIDALTEPSLVNNVWGVITIGAERIMYRYRNTKDSSVSGLLRGTAGTAIAEHASGTTVYNMSRGNLLPIEDQDYIESSTFMGDNSTTEYTTDIVVNSRPNVYFGGTVDVYINNILQNPGGYTITKIDPVVVQFNFYPVYNSRIEIIITQLDRTTDTQIFTATGYTDTFVTSNSIELTYQSPNTYIFDNFNPVIVIFGIAPPANQLVYIRNQLGNEDEFDYTFANGTDTTFVTNIDLSIPVMVYVGGIEISKDNYQVISLAPVMVILDFAPPEGTEVTVLIRNGVTWYQSTGFFASNGEPLQITETKAARFLRGL